MSVKEIIVLIAVLIILVTGIWTIKHFGHKDFLVLMQRETDKDCQSLCREMTNGDTATITKNTLINNQNNSLFIPQSDVSYDCLEQMKRYNETLHQKQSDTLQIIIYLIAVFAIIAGFFGYKTIKDIGDKAKDEMGKVSGFYDKTFKSLENQSKTSKDFYDIQYSKLQKIVDQETKRIEDLSEKTSLLYTEIRDMYSEYAEYKKEIEKIIVKNENEASDISEDVDRSASAFRSEDE